MPQAMATRLLGLICLACVHLPLLAAYPQNPLRDDSGIYVSHQGVYRFDTTRDTPLWSSLVGVETYAPVRVDEQILVGSTQGLYALDRASGRINWRIEPGRTIFSPSVAGRVYAGSLHGDIYAVDPYDGKILWRREFPGWIYSPALDTDAGLAWSGGQMHEVYALALRDGDLRKTLPTTQEIVFSPLDLDDGRAVFNLFDGSSLVVDMRGRAPPARLAGDAQPTGLRFAHDSLYRSHRDGSLAVFATRDLEPRGRRQLTARDLTLHPSSSGYLLLSDLDRKILLLDLSHPERICEARPQGRWRLPLQLSATRVGYFRINMQPPRLTLVQTQAQCN